MNRPISAPMLMKPLEAARSLAISERTLWSLTNCGQIPCVRIGRAVRYDPADIRAWIDSQKNVASSSDAAAELP